MKVIALLGHKGNGKTFAAQFLAGALKRSYIISFYDILEYFCPGCLPTERELIANKIYSVRKNFIIDSLKVKMSFLENNYDYLIIDEIDNPLYTAPLKNKLGAITVDVVKTFPTRIPIGVRHILKQERYCTTDYVLENPMIVADFKTNVLNIIKEMKNDDRL